MHTTSGYIHFDYKYILNKLEVNNLSKNTCKRFIYCKLDVEKQFIMKSTIQFWILTLTTLLVISCSNDAEINVLTIDDTALIDKIEVASKAIIDVSNLPSSAKMVLDQDFADSSIESIQYAKGLGYKVSLFTNDESITESKSDLFIGGSIIDNYYELKTCYSGTNITMSLPIVKIVASNAKNVMETAKEDDIALSRWTIENNRGNLLSQDIMRVDFIEEVLLNSINKIDDEKIFCYRFKTKNREDDSKLMKTLLEKVYDKEFKLVKFILENKGERNVCAKNIEYAESFAKECFKFE